MSKVKCPKCGHMNDANAEHCHNCGYRLKQSKTASATSFMQSIYKVAMACPRAAGDVELNTKNRDKTIEKHNYGPLNLNDKGYWELVADKWNTSTSVAKKSLCGNCVAFDISPRMDDCMPGPVSDGDGRLGYCWMHHFKCHSARTCTTWAKGGPIKKDEVSEDWQSKAKGMEKEASVRKDILDAFESEGGALGMKALKKHVKAPDLQSRLKDLIDEGRVYKHRHGDLIEKQASLSRNLAIGGGVLGAGTGALVDHDNRLRGALVGGSLGAGTGYAGGKYMEHLIDTDPSIVALKKRTAEINRESERATAAANKEIDAIKKRNQNLKKKNEAFSAKRDELERRYKNGEFTTAEYMNKLIELLQGEKVASAGEYDDSHMLSKILERMAAQSMHLKEKIDAGLIIPSWAEYKLYGAYDGVGKALGTAYPGEYDHNKEALLNPSQDQNLVKRQAKDGTKRQAIMHGNILGGAALGAGIGAGIGKMTGGTGKGALIGGAIGLTAGGARAIQRRFQFDKQRRQLRKEQSLSKAAAATATKTDPAKWEAAKREAKAKMGGKHSARAMQLATQIYKKKGGGYSGAKPTSSTNSLKKWTKQDWGYSGKDKPGQGGSGVYLPKRRRDALKSTKKGRSMLAAATRKKHKATASGQQYSSHGLAAGTSLKKSASLLKRASSRVKSPDAFYQPTMTTPAPPIETMNTGNNEAVNMQAQQVAMANQQRTQGVMPPEAPLPSIQGNNPATTPPFRPRYTGM